MVSKYQNELVTKLLNVLRERDYSIVQFSDETGIPKDRVYKWKQQGNNPKAEDVTIINNWINGTYSDKVPHGTAEKNGKTSVPGDGSNSYAEKYVALLERSLNDKDTLNELRSDIAIIKGNVVYLAELKTTVRDLTEKVEALNTTVPALREYIVEEFAKLKKVSEESVASSLGIKETAIRRKAGQSNIQTG